MQDSAKISKQSDGEVNYLPHIAFFGLAAFVLIVAGCTPSDNSAQTLATDGNKIEEVVNSAINKVAVTDSFDFAPTVEKPRTGLWLGGSPPINKRASGIDTFYKISTANKADHILMTMQFEGVKADDAYISINALDGAEIAANQPAKWRLKANAVSEIKVEIRVPETVSYLNLYTFQNGRGASRAFLLKLAEQVPAN